MKRYLYNILLALDEMGNAIGDGDPRQTISYRAAKAAEAGDPVGLFICELLNDIDPGHCARALAVGH